jgi:hypothetical protein
MSRGREFFEAVRDAAEGTPYLVTATERGFDVALDIVDAEWFGVFNKAGLTRLFIHHVRIEDDDAFSITDESRSLEWVAGTPRIAASAARSYGRAIEFGTHKVWAFDEHGDFGVQADYRFDSREGHDLIRGVAGQLGLEERRGTAERIGLVFGIIGGVGALVTVVVVVVMALLGKF